MKKWMIVCSLLLLCCVGGCSGEKNDHKSRTAGKNDITTEESSDSKEQPDTEQEMVDASNKTIIARAMGIDEDNRKLRFIVNSLHTIDAGQLQSASAEEVDGEKVMDCVAEDGTRYRIYLSKSGSVEAVKNLVTGEWPIQSQK